MTGLGRIALLLALVPGAGCNGGPGEMLGGPSQAEAGMPDDALRLTLATDGSSYPAGVPVHLTLTVDNVSDRRITLEFTSGRQYDFEVFSGARRVWNHSFDQVYTQALTTLTLEAGQRWQRSATWLQTANDGTAAKPGTYELRGLLTPGAGPLSSDRVAIELTGPSGPSGP